FKKNGEDEDKIAYGQENKLSLKTLLDGYTKSTALIKAVDTLAEHCTTERRCFGKNTNRSKYLNLLQYYHETTENFSNNNIKMIKECDKFLQGTAGNKNKAESQTLRDASLLNLSDLTVHINKRIAVLQDAYNDQKQQHQAKCTELKDLLIGNFKDQILKFKNTVIETTTHHTTDLAVIETELKNKLVSLQNSQQQVLEIIGKEVAKNEKWQSLQAPTYDYATANSAVQQDIAEKAKVYYVGLVTQAKEVCIKAENLFNKVLNQANETNWQDANSVVKVAAGNISDALAQYRVAYGLYSTARIQYKDFMQAKKCAAIKMPSKEEFMRTKLHDFVKQKRAIVTKKMLNDITDSEFKTNKDNDKKIARELQQAENKNNNEKIAHKLQQKSVSINESLQKLLSEDKQGNNNIWTLQRRIDTLEIERISLIVAREKREFNIRKAEFRKLSVPNAGKSIQDEAICIEEIENILSCKREEFSTLELLQQQVLEDIRQYNNCTIRNSELGLSLFKADKHIIAKVEKYLQQSFKDIKGIYSHKIGDYIGVRPGMSEFTKKLCSNYLLQRIRSRKTQYKAVGDLSIAVNAGKNLNCVSDKEIQKLTNSIYWRRLQRNQDSFVAQLKSKESLNLILASPQKKKQIREAQVYQGIFM
ncbi:MAG: hypothetical protein COC15_03405, partial [Legionellales bacterium]